MKRRNFTVIARASLSVGPTDAVAEQARAAATALLRAKVAQRLREIERASRGLLGVCIADTATDTVLGQRLDERFLMCSTFKLLASALVLFRVDRGQESLDRHIAFGQADLVPYSPVTQTRAGGGMSIGELCEATLTSSDNTAANLILASYGGPRALTAFARSLGDTVTRCNCIEPSMNTWREIDDTTSPRAMLHSLRRVTLGKALGPASRRTLRRWLLANTTGGLRLEAGLPSGWRIGDKTGTGESVAQAVPRTTSASCGRPTAHRCS